MEHIALAPVSISHEGRLGERYAARHASRRHVSRFGVCVDVAAVCVDVAEVCIDVAAVCIGVAAAHIAHAMPSAAQKMSSSRSRVGRSSSLPMLVADICAHEGAHAEGRRGSNITRGAKKCIQGLCVLEM
eukprot:6177253-Pleurochrysis_carterae.AAC.1